MAALSDVTVLQQGTKIVVQISWSCVTGLGPDEDEIRAAFLQAGVSVTKVEETLLSGPTSRQLFVSGVTVLVGTVGELRALLKASVNKALSFACTSPVIGSIEASGGIKVDVPVTTTISLAAVAIILVVGLIVFRRII